MEVFLRIVALVILSVMALAQTASAADLDSALPSYQKVSGVAGNLKSVGSDTLNNLMTYWAEGFRAAYPGVKISIEGKGSSTAPPALIEGAAQFGPMSREMKSKEITDFEKKFGYKPSVVRVAVDSLAVFVNKDNPLKCLTLQQLDGIFSKTRKSGAKQIKTWSDLGLKGDWADKPISIYGRNSASGTYAYFKEVALFHGDYKDTVKEQPGSSAVVQGVANDRYSIGYSGVGYKTPDVRVVPLAFKEGAKCFEANAENAYDGNYPLARFLYIYFNKKPNEPLNPLMTEFLKYVFSKEGQMVVIKDGFYPVSKALADEDLGKVGLK
ncbi:MAG: PstS family phosphate ABC transporter substrate-binding protein [Desulfomonilaceae bacterium]